MVSIYHQSTTSFLVLLGLACLITYPYIGAVTLPIWLTTALALWVFVPRLGKLTQHYGSQVHRKQNCRRRHKP